MDSPRERPRWQDQAKIHDRWRAGEVGAPDAESRGTFPVDGGSHRSSCQCDLDFAGVGTIWGMCMSLGGRSSRIHKCRSTP